MSKSTVVVGIVIVLALLALLLMNRPAPEEPTARPEPVEVIEAFDPVATEPALSERFTPPANTVVNDTTGDTMGSTQSEVAIFAFGDEILIAWNDGMFFNGGAESGTSIGYSTDRGATWTDVGAAPAAAGYLPYGDPSIVRTNAGTWLVGSINGAGVGGTVITRGTIAGGALVFEPSTTFILPSPFHDKQYLDYDPAADRVYLTYTSSGGIYVAYSTDDGVTWSTPLRATTNDFATGAYPAVGIDGEVYVSWTEFDTGELFVRHSPDGGDTFPTPERFLAATGDAPNQPPECFNRTLHPLFPSCDVDRSTSPHRGRLYATWSIGATGDFDVMFSYSDDKGATWSTPVTLNDDGLVREQFYPQMRVSDADGRILVGWHDRRNDGTGNGLCDFYITMSTDGGETFSPNRRVSDVSVSWCGVPADLAPNFGDYVDVYIDEWSCFLTWADARQGTPDAIFARVDDRHLLDIAITGNSSAEGSGTAWLIPDQARVVFSPSPVLHTEIELIGLSTVLSLLASPQDTDGIFAVGGDAIFGSIGFASIGEMSSTFSLSRTSEHDIAIDITSGSTAPLAGLAITGDWSSDLFVTGVSPGSVILGGNIVVPTLSGTLAFTVTGNLTLDGAPGALFAGEHTIFQTASRTLGADLVVDVQTSVTSTGVLATEEDEPVLVSANPFPRVTVSASPNPLTTETAIRYRTDSETRGTLRIYAASGRLVRTLVERRFAAGEGAIPFDGKDDRGEDLAAGAYFVRFETEHLAAAGKLFILR